MAIKAVLFDLDGTVLNTIDDLADSVNYALSKLGFPTRTVSEVRRICGNGPLDLITHSLPDSANSDEIKECLSVFKSHYETNMTNKTAPYEGILSALAQLRKQGFKLALVSNKHDDALIDLAENYFPGCFDFSIGSSERLPKKPAPDMVDEALSKLGVSREEAVYIGDSEVDVLTAKNSSLPCITVTWGFRDEDVLISCGAYNFVHDPNSLVSAIEKLS